MDDLLILQNDI